MADGPEQQEVAGRGQVELDRLPQEAEQRSHVLLEGLRRQTEETGDRRREGEGLILHGTGRRAEE